MQTIYEDVDNSFWIGCGNWSDSNPSKGGLVHYKSEKEITVYTVSDGLADSMIRDIYRDRLGKGLLWIATADGLSSFDGRVFKNYGLQDGLSTDIINCIYEDDLGVLWFGTNGGGVAIYDGNNWSSIDTEDGLSHNNVMSIYQQPDGTFWFGTAGGSVTKYKNKKVRSQSLITSVLIKEGELRIGTQRQLFTDCGS